MNIIPPTQWSPTEHFLLRVASWFDGTTLHMQPALIEIDRGRIVAIRADCDEAALPVLDAGALSAAPTLVDSHVHCYLSAWPIDPDHRKSPGEKTFEVEVADGLNRVAEMQGNGIGAARDMGDPKLYNNAIRTRLAAAQSPFTLQSGGQGLFMPGRYGRFLGIAADPADLEKEVDRLAKVEKVDFIKLIPTGIINFSKGTVSAPPSYSVEQITAVVNRSHEYGLKVAAHCSGATGLDRCIGGKVDFIEHAYFGTRTHLEQMRDAGLHWTPTVIPV
ncbi:MAG TPA: amidohydrolase family protein, partial [Planctomycetota bacterium]|nr:amidohydrolase family protein [Planctomycetota bacterium]